MSQSEFQYRNSFFIPTNSTKELFKVDISENNVKNLSAYKKGNASWEILFDEIITESLIDHENDYFVSIAKLCLDENIILNKTEVSYTFSKFGINRFKTCLVDTHQWKYPTHLCIKKAWFKYIRSADSPVEIEIKFAYEFI